MSMAGANSVDALLNPLSIIVRMASVEVEAVSLSAGTWPTASFFNAEVVTDTSGIVTVAASEMKTAGTDFTVLGFQPLKSEVCCPLR